MTGYDSIEIGGGDTATPLNLTKRLNLLQRYLPPGPVRFLDCGCGEGTYVRLLRRELAVEAVGIEYLADKVAMAHRDAELRAWVQQGDIEAIPFENDQFDVAMLNEVLEHVPDENRGLREILRVLRPGGRLIILSPNRWYPFETHGVFLKGTEWKLPPCFPFIPWIPLPIGRLFLNYWARNYWQGELRRLCERNGFQVLARDFLWQTFENISCTQPALIRFARPVLRHVARILEKIPGVRRFGVSQVWVLQSPDS